MCCHWVRRAEHSQLTHSTWMWKAISGEQQRRRRCTDEQFIASGGHIHDVSDRILIKTKTPMNLLKRFYDGDVQCPGRGGVSPSCYSITEKLWSQRVGINFDSLPWCSLCESAQNERTSNGTQLVESNSRYLLFCILFILESVSRIILLWWLCHSFIFWRIVGSQKAFIGSANLAHDGDAYDERSPRHCGRRPQFKLNH